MNRTLSSFLAVTVSLFVALAGTWFYLRIKAEGKPIKAPFEHPFLKSAHDGNKRLLLLRLKSPTDVPQPFGAQESLFTAGFWLDVRLAGENQLVVSPDEVLTNGPLKGKPIEVASRADCKSAGLFELADFYPVIRDRPTILNLISRRPGLSNKVLEIWGDGKPLSIAMVAMQSESDGTLKELRDAQPRGLYGSSQATLIQMEILSNLNLDGLMDLKADLIVTAIEEMKSGGVYIPRVREATLQEAHRRGLKRYAGPVRTMESGQELLRAGYDGVLANDARVFEALLHSTAL